MKLSELINAYGDDRVQFQNLDASMIAIDYSRGITKLTFGTEQPCDANGMAKLGLIVWLDRKRVAEIVAKEQKP